MRNGTRKRILSLFVCVSVFLCSLVLPFGVLATEVDAAETLLLLNRDFEDKTAVTNGFGSTQVAGNTIKLVTEEENTYMHWVYDSTEATKHGHFNIDITSYLPDEGSVVLRAKVRTTDVSSTNRSVILARPYDYHNGESIFDEEGNSLGYYSGMSALATFSQVSTASGNAGAIKLAGSSTAYRADEFTEIAFVFTWTDKTEVTVHSFLGGSTTESSSMTLTSKGYDSRPCYFRFQVSGGTNLSWDLDDLQLYIAYTTDTSAALAASFGATNRGPLFNSSAGAYVDPDAYDGHYFFKVNAEHALDKDGTTVYTLSEVPFVGDDGTIYFPVSALETVIGELTSYSPVTTVDGIPCVKMEDIPDALSGYHVSYSSCGLVAISEVENVFVEGAPDESLIPVMQKFLFDHVDSSLGKVEAFTVAEGQYLSHPYIFANQDKFDELRAIYLDEDGTADPVHKGYITTRVNSAASVYKSYAIEQDGVYSSLNSAKGLSGGQSNIYEMPYLDAQGYDIGGRHSQATNHATRIMELAFAYQITREEKYARLAYDYAVAIGGWEHWGPGHFLNCADAAAPYATAFDWLYNAWAELGLDVELIEQIIFTHAVVPGYYSRALNTLPEGWMRCISGVLTRSGWGFNGTNNWNAVCSSGMVIASLAIAGKSTSASDVYIDTSVNGTPFEKSQLVTDLGDHTGLSTYGDYAVWLINECFYGMAMKGLYQYIPDGSYIESNGYWSYGTNNFFEMVAAITTATEYNTGVSTDFGMMDAWGIDRTCYYALNTQSGDYKSFNYHDSGSTGAQNTSWFSFVGNYTGDTDLSELRNIALASGKSGSATIQDCLFYKKSTGEYTKPALQYWWEGINGYVVRDSWEAGSIYAGIMGDTNNLGHGQIDSGSFVYHNGGTIWFCDLGTENYNCYGFWGSATRYRYYKMSAEGNNTLFLANREVVPYGQALNGFGAMIETGDNAYGAYSVIDNTSVYGGYASSAYRGMLLTNDRRTLVIQDEVEFLSAETAYWVGHTQQDVIISVDGTVAYMSDGKTVIRVTIVDRNDCGARFVIEDCYTFHLDASEGMDELAQAHADLGTHEPNGDRSSYKKLTIALENVTSVKLAVVIEEVAVGEICELGYEWQSILDWDEDTPSSDGSVTKEQVALFDGEGALVGSLSTSEGNLSLESAVADGSLAYVIGTTSLSAASTIRFSSRENLSEYGFLGDRIVAAELDISTYSAFPGGVRLSLLGAGSELVGIDLSDLGAVAPTEWKRVTVLIDGESGRSLVFFGDALVSETPFVASSVEDLTLSISSSVGTLASGSIILDNVSLRVLGADYTALDATLDGGGITAWTDRMPLIDRASTPVATLLLPSDSYPGDTPLVNLDGTTYYTFLSDTGAEVTAVEIYRWSELSARLVDGATVELHASNSFDPVTVSCPITVNTNGYRFVATSDEYLAFVSGDTVEYKKGSLTVTWITDGGSVTEVYTSSVVATYKGELGVSVTEHATEGGYSYFVKDGWSLEEGGEALASEEMIVTSTNCTFYQAQKEHDATFVAVKDGTVTSFYTDEDFYLTAIKGGYDRICLLSDIVFDSNSVNHKWTGTVNLYLNGHSITYRTSVSSDHMYSNAIELNIYGPGKLVNEADAANLFLATGGNTHVEGVTIDSVRAITDHRGGTIEFVDCEINITKNTSAFGVRNRNNAVTNVNNLPTVILDGCTVNMPYSTASTAVFSVAQNSVLSVNNTEINVGAGGILFSLENTTVGTVADFDYSTAFANMAVKVGNISHNCASYSRTTSNDPSGYQYPEQVDKIGYAEGALLTEADDNILTYDGCMAVRRNDAAYPYVVTSSQNAVLVRWTVGDSSVSEYWLKGSTPAADSPAVKALVGDAENGRRYCFSVDTVQSDTELVAVYVTDFPISVSVSFDTAITVNVYLKRVDGVTLTDLTLDGMKVSTTECLLNGEAYVRISVVKHDPATAAETMLLSVCFDDANTGVSGATVTTTVSTVSYARSVLEGDYTDEMKGLMGNALKYLSAAYKYDGNTLAPEYASMQSLLEEYSRYVTASCVRRENTSLSSITTALTSAALYLGDSPAFRFYVAEGYEGEIKISYLSADGSTVSRTFDTATQLKDELRADGSVKYIELSMPAYDFAATLTVTVTVDGTERSGVYSLAMYYHAVATELSDMTEFMNAVFAYSESARLYFDSVGRTESA